jgi:hypothetical protein
MLHAEPRGWLRRESGVGNGCAARVTPTVGFGLEPLERVEHGTQLRVDLVADGELLLPFEQLAAVVGLVLVGGALTFRLTTEILVGHRILSHEQPFPLSLETPPSDVCVHRCHLLVCHPDALRRDGKVLDRAPVVGRVA